MKRESQDSQDDSVSYSSLESSDQLDGEDLIFEDMKPEDLSQKELKRQFKLIKESLEKKESINDYLMFAPQILNYAEAETGSFLIHYAIEFGQINFLKSIKKYHGRQFLLDQLKLRSNSGKNVLHILAQSCDACSLLKILHFIYKYDIKSFPDLLLQRTFKDQCTPLQLLLYNQRKWASDIEVLKTFKVMFNIIKSLKDYQMKLKDLFFSKNRSLVNTIEIIISKGYQQIFKILLKDQDINIQQYKDMQGNNLLHKAVKQDKIHIVQLLIKYSNIDQQQINSSGQTPFQIAYENGLMDICYVIQQSQTDSPANDGHDQNIRQTEIMVQKYVHENRKDNQFNQRHDRDDRKIFNEVLVHLDLKGAPPTFQFLMDFINFLGQKFDKVVTGILFEFEDTFPYDGNLKPLRGENFYSKAQIKQIIKECLPDGDLPYIHIGADEVFNMASCKRCQYFQEEASSQALYAKFVRKVCKHILKNYPKTEIILWDDMFRAWSIQDFQKFKIGGKQVIQPCIWAYSGNQEAFNQTIKTQQLSSLCLEFKKVWAASCFKGACHPYQTLVDIHERVINHKHWIDKVTSNPCTKNSIKGIILTGWSRFTHETILCELLCMSIPSLCLSLTVIEKQNLNSGIIHQQMITELNLKGKDLFIPMNDLFNSQKDGFKNFVKHSIVIDTNRPKYFCQDAFELCWMLSKSVYLYKLIKQNIKINSLLDYESLLMGCKGEREVRNVSDINNNGSQSFSQRDSVSPPPSELQMKKTKSQTLTPQSKSESQQMFKSQSKYNSSQMNEDRLNPNLRQSTVEYLNATVLMLKKCIMLSDQILPRYMFQQDIKEFKSSKIYKYLYTCEVMLEGFTKRSRLILSEQLRNQGDLRIRSSQTPDVSSIHSPLILQRNFINQRQRFGEFTLTQKPVSQVQDRKINQVTTDFKDLHIDKPLQFKVPLPPKKKLPPIQNNSLKPHHLQLESQSSSSEEKKVNQTFRHDSKGSRNKRDEKILRKRHQHPESSIDSQKSDTKTKYQALEDPLQINNMKKPRFFAGEQKNRGLFDLNKQDQ